MRSGGPPKLKLKKKYVLAFRLLMFVAALPFILGAYDALNLGYIEFRSEIKDTDDLKYYTRLLRDGAFSFFFLWLGTYGVEAATDEKGDAD